MKREVLRRYRAIMRDPDYRFSIDWPPGFVPQFKMDKGLAQSQASTRARETQMAIGKGWAYGSIPGLGKQLERKFKP